MKYIILVLSLVSSYASANTDGACGLYIPCGTYEGQGSWYDMKGQPQGDGFLERTVISKVDDHTVALEEYVYGKKQKPEDGYVLKAKFVFQADGQYTAILDKSGEAFANGTCRFDVCTFAFFPWKNSDGTVTGNVDTLRFEAGKMRRLLLVSRDIADKFTQVQKSALDRK